MTDSKTPQQTTANPDVDSAKRYMDVLKRQRELQRRALLKRRRKKSGQ